MRKQTSIDKPFLEEGEREQQNNGSSASDLFHMMWQLNDACNFNCIYWFRNTLELLRLGEHPFYGMYKPEHSAPCFDRTGKKWRIHMFGGEPFLYPDFIEPCFQLTKKHILSLNTNLSTESVFSWADMLSPEMVHSTNANVHIIERMKIEGGCGSFIEKVHYLQKKNFRVKAVYIAFPTLMERIEHDFEKLLSEGISLLEVNGISW